ncbi:glycosyltransferase family 39 protein [Dyella sp. EPa41]|uniref:ArnT family glycosyltransferase n=1 Tax=Dyella sp. EPa41 TaxID=1561194 RepID=UPI00191543C9|nr:glycosyltransferase family 39 protein [Dyella sp. EPa41]
MTVSPLLRRTPSLQDIRHGAAKAPWLWCWLLAALVAIFQHGPMPMYSTRTLSVAWEMWTHHSFIVPYLNGVPYSEKPPLLLWLIHLGWLVGGVGDVWPRLLEVALGALQLVLLAALARRLFPQRPVVAQTAPWILAAFSFGFLFGLQVMYEVLLANCVLAALLCLTPRPGHEAPRFAWFALAVGLGLLGKGPVMLLHVVFPWLLGPYWNRWAKQQARRWYGLGAAALLAGGMLLLGWVLLAADAGGETYRQRLVVHQTAGRVVDAFAHAEPFWWYVPLLPVLIFPFALWPRSWAALLSLRRPFEDGLRFLFAWLGPVLIGFSIVSGKQPYYVLPEFAGMALLMAAALASLHERRPTDSGWLQPWPLALSLGTGGVALILLKTLIRGGHVVDHPWVSLAPYSIPFGLLFLMLALLLVVPRQAALHRVALVGLIAAVAANGLFTLTIWPAYDFTPVAGMLARAEAEGHPMANLESNDGQYTFLGRLTKPVTQLHGIGDLRHWAQEHPDGLVITYPRRLTALDHAHAVYIQPFRGIWLAVWPAPAFVEAQSKGQLDE